MERSIATLKSWRFLKTRYRRPLPLLEKIVTIITGLMFYNPPKPL